MKRLFAVALGAAVSCASVFVAVTYLGDDGPFSLTTGDRERLAEMSARFRFERVTLENPGGAFTDQEVDSFIEQFDELVARVEAAADSENELERRMASHRMILYSYNSVLNRGRLSAEQEERVVAQLERHGASHPDDATYYDATAFAVRNLVPGKVAPNIVGTDFDGEEFELEEYRGKIVTIVFTGDWCPPCRGEYPYHRTLLEVVDEEHFVLLGVNSDDDLEVAKEAKARENLSYRTWWDGHGESGTEGPIATQWNISGWPTIFVIDENGVILKRGGSGARGADLITLAKELTRELEQKLAEADPDGDPEMAERRALRAERQRETEEREKAGLAFRYEEYDTGGEPFADAIIDEMLTITDNLVAEIEANRLVLTEEEAEKGAEENGNGGSDTAVGAGEGAPETGDEVPEESDAAAREARMLRMRSSPDFMLTQLQISLSQGILTEEQQARVAAKLERLAADYPDDVEEYEDLRSWIGKFLPGQPAPELVGEDLDGEEFALSDYRGKVVALYFTGDWCGPCRGEYPYQRLLLDVFEEEDFVLLGVNSDDDLEEVKARKEEERLPYRMWWDGHGERKTQGPIATAWQTSYWPTIYLIDDEGIIRRRDVRHEKLVKAARELVYELQAKRRAAAEEAEQ